MKGDTMTKTDAQRKQEDAGQAWLREKLGRDTLLLLAYNRRAHFFMPLRNATEYAYEYGGNFETVPATPDEPVREGPALMAVDCWGNVVGVGGMLPCVIGQEFSAQASASVAVAGRVERVEMVRLPGGEWNYMLTLERVAR